MTRLRQFSTAIAEIEGMFVTQEQAKARKITWPTIPQRLNNPGDLIYVGQKKATGFTIVGKDGKKRTYCQFKTLEDGWEACDFQVSLYAKRGLTVQQGINKWAPADDGNSPRSYTSGVCRLFGCKPDDFLWKILLLPEPLKKVKRASTTPAAQAARHPKTQLPRKPRSQAPASPRRQTRRTVDHSTRS
mgnify:CR=1 FL=1